MASKGSSGDGAGGAPGGATPAPVADAALAAAAGAATPAGTGTPVNPAAAYGPPEQSAIADPFPGLRPPGVPVTPWLENTGQLPTVPASPRSRASSLPPLARRGGPGSGGPGLAPPFWQTDPWAIARAKRGVEKPVSTGPAAEAPPTTPKQAPKELFIGTASPLGEETQAEKERKDKEAENKGKEKEVEGTLLAKLTEAMSGIGKSIALLTERLDQIDKEPPKNLQKDVDVSEPLKDIHVKDIDKPSKFDGQQWQVWSQNFMNFLERRDRRWSKLLKEIQAKSVHPLTPADHASISEKMGLDKILKEGFTHQLYDYLQAFTAGETLSKVIAGGREESWETWRSLCDQGKSRRKQDLHEERRRLMHPPAASLETLMKSIASWERDLMEFTVANDGQSLDEPTKVVTLEMMCPESLQEHLQDKAEQGLVSSYGDYKQAISAFIHRKTKKSKKTLNAVAAEAETAATLNPEDAVDADNLILELQQQAEAVQQQAEAINGQLYALVKGKIGRKGKGKGKAGGAPSSDRGVSPMDVDHSDKDCYACGATGHIARNCPKGQSPKGGKGGDKGKGKGKGGKGKAPGGKGGQWPSWGQWQNMHPGPSQSQWKDWWRQGKGQGQAGSSAGGLQYNGKVNLFEQGQRLSALQGSQVPWQDGWWDEPAWSPPPPTSQDVLSSLFTNGRLFALVKKGLTPKVADAQASFRHPTKFEALAQDEDDDDGAVTDPLGSGARSCAPADEPVTAKPPQGRSHNYSRSPGASSIQNRRQGNGRSPSASSFHKLSPDEVRDLRTAVSETPPLANFENKNGKVTTTGTEYATNKSGVPNPESEMTPAERYATPERAAYSSTGSSSSATLPGKMGFRNFETTNSTQEPTSVDLMSDKGKPNGKNTATLQSSRVTASCQSKTTEVQPREEARKSIVEGTGAAYALLQSVKGDEMTHTEHYVTPESAETKSTAGRHELSPAVAATAQASVRVPKNPDFHKFSAKHDVPKGTPDLRRALKTAQAHATAPAAADASGGALASLPFTSNLDNTGGQGRPGYSGTPRAGRVSNAPKVTKECDIMSFIKAPSRNVTRRRAATDVDSEGSAARSPHSCASCWAFGSDELSRARKLLECGKEVVPKQVLMVLRQREQAERLAPFKKLDVREEAKRRGWEVISAVVDSGAGVSALHPDQGKDYKIQESVASRNGVTYEVANGDDLPDLGQKCMAVLTAEGTLRGYQSQVAEVSSALQSVRRMLSTKHCVLFGLGENEEEHLVINKLTGEVNRLRDDGVNYIQDLLVVPPDEIANVAERIARGESPFPRPEVTA